MRRQRFLRPLRFESLMERLPFDADDIINGAISFGTASPSILTGNISPDIDVDMYKITVFANQTVDFDVDTPLNGPGGLGSFLRIFNSSGAELAWNNDGRAPGEIGLVGFDAYLRRTFPIAGTYYISVSNNTNTLFNPIDGTGDVAGGQNTTGGYTITARLVPDDEDDTVDEIPNLGSIGTTPRVATKDIFSDTDVDLYKFTANVNQTIDFDIDTPLNGPGVDSLGSFLRIFDFAGNEIGFNDDAVGVDENVIGYDSYMRYTFPTAGTYYVGVSNNTNTFYNINTGLNDTAGGLYSIGNYTLTVTALNFNITDSDDTLSEAINLGAITTTPVSPAFATAITPAVDVDMYRFTATAGQIVDFDIDTPQNGSGGLGSFIRLFDSSGNVITANNDAAAPGETAGFDSYLHYTFATAGTYYLGVSNSNNTLYSPSAGTGDVWNNLNAVGSYTLTIQADPADSDDTLAEAPNLGNITAAANTRNDTISLDIDVDMYRFAVSAGQVVDFNINTATNGPPGLDSFIRIFNSAGTELAFNDDGIAPGESVAVFDSYVQVTFVTAGTYYVGVSNVNNTLYNAVTGSGDAAGGANSTGAYTLNVNTAPAVPVDGDDAISEAINLGTISTTPVSSTSAAITPDVDVDMYRFAVTAGQVVDFDIDTLLNGTGGLGSFIRLFNSTGVELAFNNDAAAPGENIGFDAYLRYTFATSGTFYLGVSNASNTLYNATTGNGDVAGGANSTGSYLLTVQALPVDPDDTLAEAPLLGAITTTPIVRNDAINPDIDVDLVRFTVGNGDTVDFDIDTTTNGVGGVDSFLRLFDGSGTEIGFNNAGAAPGESTVGFDAYLRHAFAAGGTYYLGVSNANNTLYNASTGANDTAGGQNSIGSYQLIITLFSSTPVDTNDQISEAIVLGTPTTTPNTISSSIAPDTDVNMYQVTVVANQTVQFDIDTPTNGPGGLGSYLRLFNSSGTQLAFNNDGTAPGETILGFDAYVSYTFPTAGNYFLAVSNSNNITYSPSSGSGDTAGGANSVGNYQLIVTSLPVTTPALALSATVTTIAEPNGTSTGTVTRNNANITSSLVVNLSSSDTSEATVPATVTIPANQTSITFAITAADDALVDGTQNVTITATATGLTTATLPIQVTDNDIASLSLSSIASAISETNGTTTGTVTRNAANISSALVVNLSSSDTTEATVPATVTIPANQTSITFTITAVDDVIVDGTQNVTITATATGLTTATLPMLVTDNDVVAALSISGVATSISELNGTTVGTITRTSVNVTLPLVVNLTSSDTTEATVPATVTIPANQLSVTFTITAVDDFIVDGTQSVTISAAASGFTGANVGLQVTDNDSAQTLALSATALSISELNGTTIGTVTRNTANVSSPLVVNLTSSDNSEATVPATVTIPANQVSTTFTITAVDDLLVDGPQSVTITATAAGLTSANLAVQVTDNDSLWQNPDDPLDVNDDGKITAFDVIPIITFLNQFGIQPVPSTGTPPPYYDVNSDNMITSFDAIPVINYLNLNPVPSGPEFVPFETEPASAGEAVATNTQAADLYFAELSAQREKELRSAQQDRGED